MIVVVGGGSGWNCVCGVSGLFIVFVVCWRVVWCWLFGGGVAGCVVLVVVYGSGVALVTSIVCVGAVIDGASDVGGCFCAVGFD